jgi:preflagellin peptidase FlaK
VNQILDIARTVLCLSFLIYASWSDYKTREVSNKVWIIFGPIALILTGLQFVLFSPELLVTYVLAFAITTTLGFAIFYVGGFGGADAKALMCIALALPVFPSSILPLPKGLFSPIFPLTIFTNSVLFGALSVFYALFRNIIWTGVHKKSVFEGLQKESFGRKVVALVSGYKIGLTKFEHGHMYPLEDVEVTEDGTKKRKLLVFPKDEEREDIVARIKDNIKEQNLDETVWATPGLPLLIFVTLGLIVALTYGDIVWIILSLILK